MKIMAIRNTHKCIPIIRGYGCETEISISILKKLTNKNEHFKSMITMATMSSVSDQVEIKFLYYKEFL